MSLGSPGRGALRRIYQEVAPRYELVNHLLTLGLDIRWRRRAARVAVASEGGSWLDVCSGTGEMAAELHRAANRAITVAAFDLSVPMLVRARGKRRLRPDAFASGDVAHLPFRNGTFTGVTIAFAARNLNTSRRHLEIRLRECFRVLIPGGRLINLETSQPESRLWRRLFHHYAALTVRPLARTVSGSRSGYAYLAHTIPRFYSAAELDEMLFAAGAARVTHIRLWGGIAALHIAEKAR
ncbi:MAG: ubiquinone/menaquinone biosynthesis methyltransferase [Candidatus Eisenbacteria sp.]|nr:ubiquinone/menaquinone biosynthesis methyltransferase [Candidatus Eisenbacteria bacterium]